VRRGDFDTRRSLSRTGNFSSAGLLIGPWTGIHSKRRLQGTTCKQSHKGKRQAKELSPFFRRFGVPRKKGQILTWDSTHWGILKFGTTQGGAAQDLNRLYQVSNRDKGANKYLPWFSRASFGSGKRRGKNTTKRDSGKCERPLARL